MHSIAKNRARYKHFFEMKKLSHHTFFFTQQKVTETEINLSGGSFSGVIAHFVAHQGTPIVALQFDPSGMLLATADKPGHSFHLFRIQPHPLSSAQAAIHHLYTLYRGDTTAKVRDYNNTLQVTFDLIDKIAKTF